MEIAKFMVKFNNQCSQISSTIILQNLTMFIITIPDEKLELNLFNILLLVKQEEKLFIISVYRYGKMYQKNFVIANFELLKNILKQISC